MSKQRVFGKVRVGDKVREIKHDTIGVGEVCTVANISTDGRYCIVKRAGGWYTMDVPIKNLRKVVTR